MTQVRPNHQHAANQSLNSRGTYNFEEVHAVDLVDLLVEEGEVGEVEDNAYAAVVVVAALLAGMEAVVEQVAPHTQGEQLAFCSLLASVF